MKIAKVDNDGGVTVYGSLSMAAEDAGINRHRMSYVLRRDGRIRVGGSIYSIPIFYNTRRY